MSCQPGLQGPVTAVTVWGSICSPALLHSSPAWSGKAGTALQQHQQLQGLGCCDQFAAEVSFLGQKVKRISGLGTSPACASQPILAQAAVGWAWFPSQLLCLVWKAGGKLHLCQLMPSLGRILQASGWICGHGECRGSLQAGEGCEPACGDLPPARQSNGGELG